MAYEDQLIREATGEHQERAFNPFGEQGEAETLEATSEATMPRTKITQQGETFVIQCVSDSDLYWNNDVGWVDKDEATPFDSHERNTLNLPIEGKWIRPTPQT